MFRAVVAGWLIASLALLLSLSPAHAQLNLGIYLAQSICPDGSPPLVITATCSILTSQTVSDPIFFRRSDGYQMSDSVIERRVVR